MLELGDPPGARSVTILNRQVRLAARPQGIPQAEHFILSEQPVPTCEDGQILVRVRLLSIDPAMRGWVADTGNYLPAVGVGEVMRSLAAGEVIESRHPAYAVGDRLVGWFGWQDYAVVDPQAVVRKVSEPDLPLSLSLGVLGINGVTAYIGLLDIGAPEAGETVLVSTAAGAVGSAVGQIAKLQGCRTVGIAGGAAKTALCREAFGYDAAIDYKAGDLDDPLDRACPNGIDVYFDNTGGTISDTVYRRLNTGGRVVVCGTAATPSWSPWPDGPRLERHILTKRLRVQGFVVFDHLDRWEEAIGRMAGWIRTGELAYREEILDGLESSRDAIAGLYRGDNLGKRLVRL
jgi:NADPH-dependent curcumin reductase